MRMSRINNTPLSTSSTGVCGKTDEIQVTIGEWKKLGDVVNNVISHLEMLLYEDGKK